MSEQQLSKIKLLFTGFVTITICSILIWQFYHDGVPSHHLLHRTDLPAISNWWGALLLPALSWFLIGQIQKRVAKSSDQVAQNKYSFTSSSHLDMGQCCRSLIYWAILKFHQSCSQAFYFLQYFSKSTEQNLSLDLF